MDTARLAKPTHPNTMKFTIADSIQAVPAADWNRLAADNPFLNHAFLSALERHQSVGAESGWEPRYVLGHRNKQLITAVPMYLKHHSWGEFVFDWAWAGAYERNGLDYYPKLVIATPYTPVPGARLLIEDRNETQTINALIDYILDYAQAIQVSSLHCLFLDEHDEQQLNRPSLIARADTQYHWINHDYEDFDAFLAQLASRHRKKVKRERRRIEEAEITVQLLHGNEINDEQWDNFYRFHRNTYLKRGHQTPFTSSFFKEIGATMADNIIMITAQKDGQDVAAALNFVNSNTLYGRYWGCLDNYHSLHFEVCYYRAIDYCIASKLKRFEAGAQGEHKLVRGFYPTTTHSRHWIAHPAFREAIKKAVDYERQDLGRYQEMLSRHLPYKKQPS